MPKKKLLRSYLHPRFWPTWMGIGLISFLGLLPLPLIWLPGVLLGRLLYYLHAERRHVASVNIKKCFPRLSRREHKRLLKRHFQAFGQTLLDFGIAWWASEYRLKRLIRFRGKKHYDNALAKNKNVILLAPHFLGLEIGGIYLSTERPIVTIFRHPDNELLRVIMERRRMRFGLKLVEHNKALTSLVKQVKSGSPLYYLPDQDAGRRNAVFAPFFGIPTATFSVLGRLARLSNAVVIPCFTRQLPWGRGYEIIFRSPLENFSSGNLLTDTTRMNKEIEEAVRKMPEQYFWLHKRFKTRPKGEKSFYS